MKSKIFRKKLLAVMESLIAGKMQPEQARAVIGAANQVHLSLEDEIKHQKVQLELRRKVCKFGEMIVSSSE